MKGDGVAMYLKEIWRYPVKSMAGEQLPEAVLGPMDNFGDRKLCVKEIRFIGRRVNASVSY